MPTIKVAVNRVVSQTSTVFWWEQELRVLARDKENVNRKIDMTPEKSPMISGRP
jgi:hypothetical protein